MEVQDNIDDLMASGESGVVRRTTLPTMYFADETALPPQLRVRHRHRSDECTLGSSTPESKTTGYIKMDYSLDLSPGDSGYSASPASTSFSSIADVSMLVAPDQNNNCNSTSAEFSEELIPRLRKHFQRRQRRLFDSGSGTTPAILRNFFTLSESRLQELIPLVIVFIVVTSAVVTICTLNRALGQHGGNSKYRSIEFAHSRRLQREKRDADDSNLDMEVNDVTIQPQALSDLQDQQEQPPLSSVEVATDAPSDFNKAGLDNLQKLIDDMKVLHGMELAETIAMGPGQRRIPTREEKLRKLSSFGQKISTTIIQHPDTREVVPLASEASAGVVEPDNVAESKTALYTHAPKSKKNKRSYRNPFRKFLVKEKPLESVDPNPDPFRSDDK